MSKERLCFCGSKKTWSKCHSNVVPNSMFVKIHRIYKKIDKEILKQIKEKNLVIKCKKGCGECCISNFDVSELEFCMIVDYLLKKNNSMQIETIIERACKIKDCLSENYPGELERLESDSTGLTDHQAVQLMLNGEPRGELDKCIFLSDRNTCTIYDVRPLICRTYGTSYFGKNYSHKICSKMSISTSNLNEFVDLTQFEEVAMNFHSFYDKKENRIHLRRNYPLFYWFIMLKENNISLNKFSKMRIFSRYTLMDEEECGEDIINSLANR